MPLNFLNTGYFADKVGIGTDSPGTKLDISVTPSAPWMKLINADETAFNLTTYNNGTNNGNTVYAFKHGLYYNSTENAAVTFYRGGSSVGGFLTFTTNNGTERMRIDSAGNVGIGTDSPGTFLQLGTYNVGEKYINQATYPDIPSEHMMHITAPSTFSYYGGGISFGETAFTAANIVVRDAGAGGALDLCFGTGTATGVTEKMRIANDGNVGIGTDNPRGKLEVEVPTGTGVDADEHVLISDGVATNPQQMRLGVNTASNYSYIQSAHEFIAYAPLILNPKAGNVGIGTISPDYDLDVERTATTINDDPTIGIRNAWGGQGNNTGFSNRADLLNSAGAGTVIVRTRARYDASANWGEIGTTTAHDFNIRTSGTHRITVQADGDVGIGTTTPQSKLQVAKNGNANGGSLLIGVNGSGTGKFSFLAGAHYDQATGSGNGTGSAGVALIGSFAGSGVNVVYIGGGPYEINAATSIGFWTNPTSLSTAGGTQRMNIANDGDIRFNAYGAGVLVTDSSGNITATTSPPVDGITFNNGATITNQVNTDVDTGTETVAEVSSSSFTAAFFDFVIKKTTNVRSGTVYACHDGAGTPLIAFTETSTQDLGDTSDVTLSVDISGGNMRLRATTTSDDWSIKSLIRAI